jgi:hypothetical protein
MNINQILNSALLTESEMTKTNSEKSRTPDAYAGDSSEFRNTPLTDKELKNYKANKAFVVDQKTDANQTPLTGMEIFNKKYPNALKYGGAAAIGLGAGIGALALAKKLRAKKAAAKAGKSKKD